MSSQKANAGGTSKLSELIATRLSELRGVDLNVIARKAGFSARDVLEMFANGEANVPYNSAIHIGYALDLDPAVVFRLAIEQYWPPSEVDRVIPPVSEPEWRVLHLIRDALKGRDLVLTHDRELAIRQIFEV